MAWWYLVLAFAKLVIRRFFRNAKVDLIAEAITLGVEALKMLGLNKNSVMTIVDNAYEGHADNVQVLVNAAKASLPPPTQSSTEPLRILGEKSATPDPQASDPSDRRNLGGLGASAVSGPAGGRTGTGS